MTSWLSSWLLLACLLCHSVASANPFTSSRQITLDNGLSLYYVQVPKARFFKFSIYVWAGSVDETPGVNDGVAHFLEHLVFQQEHLSEAEFDRAIESLGGSHNAFTHRPFTRYYVFLPKAHLARGSELLWSVVFNDKIQASERDAVLKVIDQENRWSDPTWVDALLKPFTPPPALKAPGFWQAVFDLKPYDQSVGGKAKVSRQLQVAQAEEFRRRFYRVPNMTAIYVGPDSLSKVVAQLNQQAARQPGALGGELNRRPPCARYGQELLPYRRVQFDDQQPTITLGYLLNQVHFADSPHITLFTESLNRNLYQTIRQQSSATYSTERFVESFRECGYVAFRSQSSRLRFDDTYRYMHETILGPYLSAVSPQEFEHAKGAYLGYLNSKLDNPEFVEAYVSLLVREHPTHQPSPAELDWLGSIRAVDYQELATWAAKRLDPQQYYESTVAPSLFIPYEMVPLILLSCIGVFFLWRRSFTQPEHLRALRYQSELKIWPIGWLQVLLTAYPAYWLCLLLVRAMRQMLDWGMQQQIPLYLGGYLNLLLMPMLTLSVFMITASVWPRRLLVTKERLTVVATNQRSRSLRLAQITDVERLHSRQLWRRRLWPSHLFWSEAVAIHFVDPRRGPCSWVYAVKDSIKFIEELELARGQQGQQEQLRLFPGIAPAPSRDN